MFKFPANLLFFHQGKVFTEEYFHNFLQFNLSMLHPKAKKRIKNER